jgi:hypothetical protein
MVFLAGGDTPFPNTEKNCGSHLPVLKKHLQQQSWATTPASQKEGLS